MLTQTSQRPTDDKIGHSEANLNLETIRITESKTEANEIRIVAETMQLAPTNEAGSKPLLRQVANKVSSVGLR